MFFNLIAAGLACALPYASAYTQPVGDSPSGNPISQPGLNSIVPVGEAFTVTWEPTTTGSVTLVLLKGPATNAVPQYAIAESIKNSGSYAWTPKDDLAPGETGYGIQLIDDATGAYQYTTQFGISNPNYEAPTTSSSSAASWSAASSWESWPSASATWPAHPGAPAHNATWGSTNTTTAWATGTASSYVPIGTGATTSKPANVTMTAPGVVTPTSLKTSAVATTSAAATTSSAPVQTGAASTMATSFAGLVFAAGVAVFAI